MRATEVTLRPYPWNTCHQLLPGLLHLGGDEVADSEDIIPVDVEVLYIVWTPRTIFITKKYKHKGKHCQRHNFTHDWCLYCPSKTIN